MNYPKKYNIGEIYGNLQIIGEGKGHISINNKKTRTVICKNILTLQITEHTVSGLGNGTINGNKKNNYKYTNTILYKKYQRIKERCNNKNNISYKNYGGRGINCEWKNFEEFYNDMSESYKEGFTIDRIDNNGNYCKQNCRWADKIVQANNTRRNIYFTYNGEIKTLKQWCDELGLKYKTIFSRIKYKGYSFENAIKI